MSKARRLADAFISALRERPEDFVSGDYTLLDKKTSQNWWIANGPAFFGIYSGPGAGVSAAGFFAIHGIRCHRAIREWKTNKALSAMAAPGEPK